MFISNVCETRVWGSLTHRSTQECRVRKWTCPGTAGSRPAYPKVGMWLSSTWRTARPLLAHRTKCDSPLLRAAGDRARVPISSPGDRRGQDPTSFYVGTPLPPSSCSSSLLGWPGTLKTVAHSGMKGVSTAQISGIPMDLVSGHL